MNAGFLTRRAVQLLLTANAFRPITGRLVTAPGVLASGLTIELAPQLLTLTVADLAQHLARHGVRGGADRAALVMGGLSAAGLARLTLAARGARTEVEEALADGLGEDYRPRTEVEPTPWRQLLMPFLMRDPNVTRVRDVRYAPGGRRGLLDVYHRPDRPSGAPVLLQVHGGAWMVGTKNGQAIPLMQRMARRGWVCVAPNYPLSPKAAWPEHVIALKRAIAWIRENIAEYGGDPSFIATTGGSAGGHLSALLALTPNDPAWQPGFTDADTSIQACVPHYGAYDLASTSGLHHDLILRDEVFGPKVVQKPFAGNEQIFRDASPLLRVNPDAPPFFVVHGATDTLLSVATARMFAQRLREVSAQPVAYLELSGAQHGFDMFPSIRSAHVLNGVQRFLDWSYRRTRTRPLVAL